MAKAQLVTFGNVAVIDALTRYMAVSGTLDAVINEERREMPVRAAGSFSDFYVRVVSNTISANSIFTVRKTGVDTALAVAYASDETGVKEDADVAAFAATDRIVYQLVTGTEAGTNTITFTVMGIAFTASADTACILGSANGDVLPTDASMRFSTLLGTTEASLNETNAQLTVQGSVTLSDFWAYVSANARTSNTIFGTRKNGAAGAQSVTYAAAETGLKEDASNTDSLVAGNTVNTFITTEAGSGSITIQTSGALCTSTAGQFPLAIARLGGLAQSFNVTNNWGVGGNLFDPMTTEADTQLIPSFTFTAKSLTAFVSANSIATSNTTIALRDGGANGNGLLTYTPAETGVKTDADGDVITAATDTLNFQCVTPNTSGTFTIRNIHAIGEVAAVGGRVLWHPGMAGGLDNRMSGGLNA